MSASAWSSSACCWRSWSHTLAVSMLVLAGAPACAEGQVAAVASEAAVLRAGASERPAAAPFATQARPLGDARVSPDDGPTVARISVEKGRTTFEGTGIPSTLVELTEGAQLIGIASVDSAGRWLLTVDRPLAVGDHRISTSARDPARAKVTVGQDVLLSIPEGFTGTTILSQRASAAAESPAADSQRRRLTEQSAIAEERFSEVMSSPEWRRIAQSSTPAPRPAVGPLPEAVRPNVGSEAVRPNVGSEAVRPNVGSETVRLTPVDDDGRLGQLFGWFDRASRDYHEQVVKRLADPRPLPTEGLGASRTETPTAAAKGPVRTVQSVPPASSPVPQSQAPSLAFEPKSSAPSTVREVSVLESLQGMLERAGRDYREGVVRKLAQPSDAATPPAPPLGPTGPVARVGDAREADALRKADEDRRAAEARRLASEQKQAELQKMAQPPKAAEQPAAVEDQAAIEARRIEAEQRMAAARRADEERRAEEARQDSLRRQADAAKRADDEKRAAEQAKAEDARRSLEAAQRDAQRSGQEMAERQRQAALEEAQRKAQDAQRAEDARRAQETAAAAAARRALEEGERQRADAQRIAVAKAAEDERRRAEDERRRAASLTRPAPEAVAPVTPKASGFRTEDEYRRALAEAARAPKVPAETTGRPRATIEPPARPQVTARLETPRAQQDAVTPAPKPATGFRSDEEYRRALIEASRAPKVTTRDVGASVSASKAVPTQAKPRPMTRAEAERAAREMLQGERLRVAELKSERDRKAAERKRAEELRIAAAAPKLIEPAQTARKRASAPVIEEGSATRGVPTSVITPGRSLPPPPRKEERRVAECPAAGRRVSLPGAYIVKSGDTLWKIAERFYSDGEAYQRILKANKGKVPNPDIIEPCLKLILPRR